MRVTPMKIPNTFVVLGALFGDEGKGKIVDLISKNADVVCRFQGGNNAGHTVVLKNREYFFHLIPSGLLQPNTIGIIGNGVVVDITGLFHEIDNAVSSGILDIESRLFISNRCHIIFSFLRDVDHLEEVLRGSHIIGTTKRGIGPTYSVKANRYGLRMSDLMGEWNHFRTKFICLVEYVKRRYSNLDVNVEEYLNELRHYRNRLSGMVVDTVGLINRKADQPNCRIVIEGAQCSMLDVDFGTYPFVTSSNSTVGGVCTGLGLPPSKIGEVYGVVKAYSIRVGSGPFPTEMFDEIGERIQKIGKEWGVTTKRKRRIGWLDTVVVRYSHLINNFTALALTKIDVLDGFNEVKIGHAYINCETNERLTEFPADINVLSNVKVDYMTLSGWKESTKGCTAFEDLPWNAKLFVKMVEQLCGLPIRWIGTGPSREDIIYCDVCDH